jgi:hypothetical protein
VSQPWAGVPVTISGPTNTIVNTDQTGQINVGLQAGNYTITTPDDATKYSTEQQMTNFSEDADIGDRQVFHKDYPLDKLCKFQNYAIVLGSDPSTWEAWITKWGDGLYVEGGEKDTLRTLYVDLPMDRYQEIREHIRNINTHAESSAGIMLELPVAGSDNMIDYGVSSIQEETDIWLDLWNNIIPNNKAVFIMFSSYGMGFRAGTNDSPHRASGPHIATKGYAITTSHSGQEPLFTEVITMLLRMHGETDDPSWIETVFEDPAKTTSYPTQIDYRNTQLSAEIIIGKGQKSLPVSTKISPYEIIYKDKEF